MPWPGYIVLEQNQHFSKRTEQGGGAGSGLGVSCGLDA